MLLCLPLVQTLAQENTRTMACGVNDAVVPAEILEQMQKAPQWMKSRANARIDASQRYICRIAIDIDSDTYALFNQDTTLIKYEAYKQIERISKIYEKEINTQLVVTYINIWKDSAKDPYKGVSDIFKMLGLVADTWANNANLKAVRNQYDKVMYLVTKGFSGAGGVAYLGGVESVSPWGENGDSRGLMVVAHELGHNFGSPHTQNCSWAGGVIDHCYPAESNCYENALEKTRGSIMSYCSYAPTFHPLCQAVMQQHAISKFAQVASLTSAPVLPANYTLNNTSTFVWQPLVSAEKYLLEIASVADFSVKLLSDTTYIQGYSFGGFKPGQQYFVRVKAINAFNTTPWSNVAKIQVNATGLIPPKLLYPQNQAGDIAQNTSLTLKFDAAANATSYEVQVTTFGDPYFKNPNKSLTTTTNSCTFTTPNYNQLLWRVRAVNASGQSAWSEVNTFWLKPAVSSAINIPNSGTNVPLTFPITYTGNSVLAGATVKFTLSTKSDFSSPVLVKTFAPNQFLSYNYVCMAQSLTPNTTYYLKVEEWFESSEAFAAMRNLPQGLMFQQTTQFTTGTTVLSSAWSFFNNDNKPTFNRDLGSLAIGARGIFVKNAQGLVKIDPDTLNLKVFDRASTNGLVGNQLSMLSVTNNDNALWMINTMSKRIEYSGVFPKTTYNLLQLNQQTGAKMSSVDLSNPDDVSPSSFDMNSKIVYGYAGGGYYVLAKIESGKITTLIKFNESNKYYYTPVWNSQYAWVQVYDWGTGLWELRRYDLAAKTFTSFNNTNTPFAGRFYYQYKLDTKGLLWVTLSDGSYIRGIASYDGSTWKLYNYKNVPLLSNPNNFTFDNANNLYVFDNARVLKYDGTSWQKLADFPLADNFKDVQMDAKGKMWLMYAHGMVRFSAGDLTQIATSPLATNQFCLGTKVDVSFTTTGNVAKGNIYTVQLSDANGSFSTPVTIGTLSSEATKGTIAATIPTNLTLGTKYRVRVVASNPTTTGFDNGSDVTLIGLPTGTLTGTQSIIASNSGKLTVNLSGTSPWSFTINDQNITGVTSSPYTHTVSPSTTTTYTLSKVTNVCGTVTPTSNNTAVVTVLPQQLTNKLASTSYCQGSKVSVAFTSTGTFKSDNVYSVELSDALGSFAKPVVIGKLSSLSNTGTIEAIIPTSTQGALQYRLRVVSSSPQVVGADNGANILIQSLPTGTLTGTQSIIASNSGKLTVNLSGTSPWSFTINDQNVTGVTSSPYTHTVSPTATTTYTLSKVTNVCGTVTPTSNNTAVVTVLPQQLTNKLASTSYCQSSKVSVAFTSTGTFKSDNVYTVELSDALGSFAKPVVIGKLSSLANTGTIEAIIPTSTQGGSLYRLRVVSSSPQVVGADNGANLLIQSLPTGTLTGTQSIIASNSGKLTVNLSGTSPWSFTINDQNVTGVTSSPYTHTVSPTATTTYTLSKVTNVCGTVTPTSNNTAVVTVLPQQLTNKLASTSYCQSSKVSVAFTSTGTFKSDNVYTVELSDALGSFAKPVVIGKLSSLANTGTIEAIIPTSTQGGSLYRLRVVSSSPQVVGADNGANLLIQSLPTGTLTGTQSIIASNSGKLTVNLSGTSPWSFTINDQNVTGVTSSPYTHTVSPTATTTYTLSKVTNVCGTVTPTSNNTAVVTVLPQQLTNKLASTSYCQSSKVSVAFTSTGTFKSDNVYTVELSDALGSFAKPVVIGKLSSLANTGTIEAIIPTSTQGGSLYRLRVVSSSPQVVGADNGANLLIQSLPTGTLTGTQSIIASNSGKLTVNLSGTSPWSFTINDQNVTGVTSSPYTHTVSPTATTTYTLSKVTNVCGTVTPTSNNTAVVTVLPQQLTNKLASTSYCQSSKVSVAFTSTGTFKSDNVYTVELSDALGSFAKPVVIGKLSSLANTGTIEAIIPTSTQGGSLYRLRVVSSSPQVVGADNGANLLIQSLPTGTLTGTQSIIASNSGKLTVNLSGTSPWSFTINDQNVTGVTSSPYTHTVSPTATTTYTLSKVTNVCGTVTPTSNNTAVVTVLPQQLTNKLASTSYCQGSKVSVAFTSTGTFKSDNVYSVELSDALGSFAKPVVIGKLSSLANTGAIESIIPTSTQGGSLYRLRVVSSSPQVVGTDNGANILIQSLPTGTLTGTQSIIASNSGKLTVNLSGTSPWSFTINEQSVTGITSSPYTHTVSPSTTTTYTLSKVTNVCGTVTPTSNNTAVVTVTPKVSNSTVGTQAASQTQVVADMPIAISEQPATASFKAYPSPSDGTVGLHYDALLSETAQVSVVSMTGEVVQSTTVTARQGTNVFEMKIEQSGMYFIRLTTASGVSLLQKIQVIR